MATPTKHGAIGPPVAKGYTVHEAIDHLGFGRFQCKIVFISGLALMCEAVCLVTSSLIGPILQCQFNLTALQQAAFPIVGMLGMSITSPCWGKMGDLYGRKSVLLMSTSLMGYFKILTSFSPNVYWIYINMFCVGTCFGGVLQSVTLCSEYTPTKHRQNAGLATLTMFGFAAVAMNVLAKLAVPTLGWRWMLVISTLPEWSFLSLSYFIPESVRFMLVSGRYNRAKKLMDTIARDNKRQLPDGYLAPLGDKTDNSLGKISDLFAKDVRPITIPMIIAWFTTGLCYFGISLITPVVFLEADGCHGSDVSVVKMVDKCTVACQGLTGSDFSSLVIASIGEIVGLPIALLVMTLLSRRSSLFFLYSVQAATSFISIICMQRIWITALMFITRTSVAAGYAVILIFNIEVYPTKCRSVGVGVNAGVYKFGSVISPIIGQLLASYMLSMGFLTYGLLGVMGIVAVYLIPIETKNKGLKDTDWESNR